MLQGHDKEHGICLEADKGAMRRNDIMGCEFRKTRQSSCCKKAWIRGATIEAAEPKRKKS